MSTTLGTHFAQFLHSFCTVFAGRIGVSRNIEQVLEWPARMCCKSWPKKLRRLQTMTRLCQHVCQRSYQYCSVGLWKSNLGQKNKVNPDSTCLVVGVTTDLCPRNLNFVEQLFTQRILLCIQIGSTASTWLQSVDLVLVCSF